MAVKAGTTIESKLPLELMAGYHVNSNMPSETYLIPLKLTWNDGPVTASSVAFPKPTLEKYTFSEKPLSVFSGRFEIVTKFTVPANAQLGPLNVAGKLRYQACNDRMCLAPKTIDVTVPLNVVK
jgi:thiol:disulfide interchange protein DsbD